MEHLTKKPYYLTDEDILWVGNTLADMTPAECADADQVKQALREGRAAMFVCTSWDADALARYQACINAAALFARVPAGEAAAAARVLRDELGFNGIIIEGNAHADENLREEMIKNLSLQAALGLHKG